MANFYKKVAFQGGSGSLEFGILGRLKAVRLRDQMFLAASLTGKKNYDSFFFLLDFAFTNLKFMFS